MCPVYGIYLNIQVVSGSLLKGTEAPICWSDSEVCCLIGAEIQDIAKRVQHFLKSTDCYSQLLFHVGWKLEHGQNQIRL